AGGAEHENHEENERAVRDRPFGEVEAHDATPAMSATAESCKPTCDTGVPPRGTLKVQRASIVRTFSPGSSFCTPGVTAVSPSLRPAVTITASSLTDATVTGRRTSVLLSTR